MAIATHKPLHMLRRRSCFSPTSVLNVNYDIDTIRTSRYNTPMQQRNGATNDNKGVYCHDSNNIKYS